MLKNILNETKRLVSESAATRRLYVWRSRAAVGASRVRSLRAHPDALFRTDASLSRQLEDRYLYVPWIPHHGDALVERLRSAGAPIEPFELFRDLDAPGRRKSIIRFVRRHPDAYRTLLRHALAPIAPSIRGVVLSFDWAPPQRQLAYVCRELGIRSILVPHEGVFASRDAYYRDVVSGADYPICDEAWVWGSLQAEIFAERGYPRERIAVVGSPKLDRYLEYTSTLSRLDFARRYGFHEARPIVLFAMQPLDSQFDEYAALRAQNRAVLDLLSFVSARDAQLLVRGAPSGHRVLERSVQSAIERTPHAAFDAPPRYRSTPEEAIFHSDVVVSVNSTMLFEAVLLGRPAVSTRYVHFEQVWSRVGIPAAETRSKLFPLLDAALRGDASARCPSDGLAWAARAFSVGAFDGRATSRIVERLREPHVEAPRRPDSAYAHLFRDHAESPRFGTLGFHRSLLPTMRHVPAMLGFREWICPQTPDEAARCDVFAKWGIRDSRSKSVQDGHVRSLARPQLILEDGFLRSIDIGLSGAPGLSVIVDDKTAHFDARRASRLEDRLNGAYELSSEQRARALSCIERIRAFRVSKYNHAPDRSLGLEPGTRAVLLVDQRYGDDSVTCGLADDASFSAMLDYAFATFPNHRIVIKRHPDATRGERKSYFSDDTLYARRDRERIHSIDFEVNPHSLFDQVEDVLVVTSGMGFEALLAGKRVHCFGAPFYSNWGVTLDQVRVPRRQRRRSVVELFHFAYIEASRYFDPSRGTVGELEDTLQYIATHLGRPGVIHVAPARHSLTPLKNSGTNVKDP